jgi:surface protein
VGHGGCDQHECHVPRRQRVNQSIGDWDTAKVNGMNSMFSDASAFNQSIGDWDTAAVTDMYSMFRRASAFNQAIGNWNTAAVTNMAGMFYDASAFNQSIGDWDTAAVTDMSTMFRLASAFNQDISKWNTAKVTDRSPWPCSSSRSAGRTRWRSGTWSSCMLDMFVDASAFNQKLCWDVTGKRSKITFFLGPGARVAAAGERARGPVRARSRSRCRARLGGSSRTSATGARPAEQPDRAAQPRARLVIHKEQTNQHDQHRRRLEMLLQLVRQLREEPQLAGALGDGAVEQARRERASTLTRACSVFCCYRT